MTKKMSVKSDNEMPQIIKSKVEPLFTLIKSKENVKIALGNFQLSKEKFKNVKNAEKYIASKPYELLVNVSCLIAEQTIKNYETLKETKKDA